MSTSSITGSPTADAGSDCNMSDPKQGQIDFLQDLPGHMTFGRRFALFLSRRYAWYYPQLAETSKTASPTSPTTKNKNDKNDKNNSGNEKMEKGQEMTSMPVQEDKEERAPENKEMQEDVTKPSLERAWAFFEHVTLRRYVVKGAPTPKRDEMKKLTSERVIKTFHKGANRKLDLAEPGEMNVPTKLYSPLTTPLKQLGDFGLGYGMYFATLRAFAILSLCAALLNVPNIVYFKSFEYSAGQPGVKSLLQGSAICTEQSWVPCPTCVPSDFESQGAFTTVRMVSITGFIANETAQKITGGGKYLNITSYLDWDGFESAVSIIEDEAADSKTFYSTETDDKRILSDRKMKYIAEKVFTNETIDSLYQDYGIQFKENEIVFEGNASVTLPCSKNCIFDYVWCQEKKFVGSTNDFYCYLYVADGVPLGDTSPLVIPFALKNECEGATMQTGMVNYATVFLFIFGALYIRRYQKKIVVEFDEDEQTAQDYSISISNPPPDAYDPEEWKQFFESNFQDCKVTVCTVAVDNDALASKLVKRREILRELQSKLPDGTSLDESTLEREAEKAEPKVSWYNKLFGSTGVRELYKKLQQTNDTIREELKKSEGKPCTDVFVTFETEKAKRDVLKTLTVGAMAVHNNDSSRLPDPKFLFRGKHVLRVHEPEEPSTIRWPELNASFTAVALSNIAMTLVTLLLVVAGCVIIILCYMHSTPIVAGYVTTMITEIFPYVSQFMMGFEWHRSESSRQTWMFIKTVLFNILVTAALLDVISPFAATLDNQNDVHNNLIPSVQTLFHSQLFFSPAFQLVDPIGNFKRHILAPRAKTQEEMNSYFLGSETYLAARYANMIKFLFLMVWYCAVYPATFFMGFLAYTIIYFVDRFSLMRTWARTPQVGTQISAVARNVFVPIAIVVMAVLSAYAWSGFPYDNLCPDGDFELHPGLLGDFSLRSGSLNQLFGMAAFDLPKKVYEFNITVDVQLYKYCDQDFRSYITLGRHGFPPIPKFQIEEWMTDEQAQLLNIYGWTSVAILGAVVGVILLVVFIKIGQALYGKYEPRGQDMGIKFSEVPVIDSYIPQVKSEAFPHPFLLCDVKEIDEKLFNWKDPDRPYSYYDLTLDANEMVTNGEVPQNFFSRVKYWPVKVQHA